MLDFGHTRQSVLESVDGDQDKAIDKLLGMSDPEYEHQHAPVRTNSTLLMITCLAHDIRVQDQTELDEQLARQLMLEDHERQLNEAPADQRSRSYGSQFTGAQPVEQASNGNTSRPEFREVTDTFNKIAEGEFRVLQNALSH
jgi:hypothetical protein